MLQGIYINTKQTLIHGNLNGLSILYSTTDTSTTIDNSDESLALKVVGFEAGSYGPAGLDLGTILNDYLYYFTAHSYLGIIVPTF